MYICIAFIKQRQREREGERERGLQTDLGRSVALTSHPAAGPQHSHKSCVIKRTYIKVLVNNPPSDRPKSVRNRCVIDVFMEFLCCHVVTLFMLSRCFLDFFVGIGAFVIRLSQISSFFLLNTRGPQQPNKAQRSYKLHKHVRCKPWRIV